MLRDFVAEREGRVPREDSSAGGVEPVARGKGDDSSRPSFDGEDHGRTTDEHRGDAEGHAGGDKPPVEDSTGAGGCEAEGDEKAQPRSTGTTVSDPEKLKRAIVMVSHDGRRARLLLNRRPSAEGWAWLKHEDDGQEFEAELVTVQLAAVIEG